MGKIYCIMGKSSTGKDTLFKKILGDESLSLKTIVPYTTRPVRAGEKNGVEYFFCDEKKVEELEREGRIIELRAYDTIHGIWKYFTSFYFRLTKWFPHKVMTRSIWNTKII